MTLGQLLRMHQPEEVMITLKDFSKKVNIEDEKAYTHLNRLIKEISFLNTFYKKFEKTIEKLELKERYP